MEFFSEYGSVRYIDLSYSQIHKIADFALSLSLLTEVNLQGNELISLSAGVFNEAISLRKIDLSYNKISVIQPEVFSNLLSLVELNLSHNQLNNNSFGRKGADWTDKMENLRSLDLSHNRLFYYEIMPYQAFSGLINLESLNLRSNRIKIDYGALSSNQKLKSLDFSYNKMTYFDLNYLLSVRSLKNLFLHGNGISYPSQIDLSDIRAIFPDFESLGISENSFPCEVLSVIIKKMDKATIQLVIEEGKFVNDRRNLRGVACV
jgi:Leucine-rich repeat (LRR) protein